MVFTKTFLIHRKTHYIFHLNRFVTDFKEKSELLNSFCNNQCSLVDTNISLPSIIYFSEHRLSKINFTADDICKIIRLFEPNKVHNHDKITLHKKWSFPLRISTVNVTKSEVSCGFGHLYWRNSKWKTSFFVPCQNSCTENI